MNWLLAMVGTANMDFRSFDLNFEVNAIVYDSGTAGELSDIFYRDIAYAKRIDAMDWKNRPRLNSAAGFGAPVVAEPER